MRRIGVFDRQRHERVPGFVVIGFALPATRWSKGQTVKIVVRGDHLASPIEITDPNQYFLDLSQRRGELVSLLNRLGEAGEAAHRKALKIE